MDLGIAVAVAPLAVLKRQRSGQTVWMGAAVEVEVVGVLETGALAAGSLKMRCLAWVETNDAGTAGGLALEKA